MQNSECKLFRQHNLLLNSKSKGKANKWSQLMFMSKSWIM